MRNHQRMILAMRGYDRRVEKCTPPCGRGERNTPIPTNTSSPDPAPEPDPRWAEERQDGRSGRSGRGGSGKSGRSGGRGERAGGAAGREEKREVRERREREERVVATRKEEGGACLCHCQPSMRIMSHSGCGVGGGRCLNKTNLSLVGPDGEFMRVGEQSDGAIEEETRRSLIQGWRSVAEKEANGYIMVCRECQSFINWYKEGWAGKAKTAMKTAAVAAAALEVVGKVGEVLAPDEYRGVFRAIRPTNYFGAAGDRLKDSWSESFDPGDLRSAREALLTKSAVSPHPHVHRPSISGNICSSWR